MILLLVEDEPYTREGIITAIDWNALGISKVLTAENGQRGLEIARKHSPDIVLADMRMPRMDGADMAKGIKEILPGCIFIFMSGYSDLIYYKSALQVSALDYVTKPLVIDELAKVLEKGVKQVKANKAREEYISSTKSHELALYIINENAEAIHLIDMWTHYGMPYGENYTFYTLILKQNHSGYATKQINELAQTLGIWVSVGWIKAGYLIHTVVPRNNDALLHKFSQGLLHRNNDEVAYVAIGKPVNHPMELKESYDDAASLINLSFYHPERRLFVHGEPTPSLVNGYDQISELSQLLLHSPQKVRLWTENQFEKIKLHTGTPIELVKYWGFRMCTDLYFQLDRIKKNDILTIPTDEAELWNKISSLNTLDELKSFVLQVIDKLEDSHKTDAKLPVIAEVQRYIYNHFSTPLTLETLSKRVNLSITYLCGIFKEATGQTINQYIMDVRIHRAKLMLESTRMHINEIAHATGYSSSSYFIKAFRKATGTTPQEYRKDRNVYENEI